MVQGVTGPTNILGHSLDVLFSPFDSEFVWSVNVDDFISDHVVRRSRLDSPTLLPALNYMSLIVGITRLIMTSFTRPQQYSLLVLSSENLPQNYMISMSVVSPIGLTSMYLSFHSRPNSSQLSGCLNHTT